MDTQRVKMPGGVARVLGVSPRTARRIASSDPDFPPVVVLGPRTQIVDETALRQYLQLKTRRLAESVKS